MNIAYIIAALLIGGAVGCTIALLVAGASKSSREVEVWQAGYRRGRRARLGELDEARHESFKEGYEQGYIVGLSADKEVAHEDE